MPGAISPQELGSQLMNTAPNRCSDVATYYKTNMPIAGWSLAETQNPSNFRLKYNFMKGRHTAEINLSDSTGLRGESVCIVQIFLDR